MLQVQPLIANSAWVLRSADGAQALLLLLMVVLLLGALPLAWLGLRRWCGSAVAGPLWPLLLVELLAACYAFSSPPWEMPDEPRHMEYVELLRLGRPTAVAPVGDQEVARTIVSSLMTVEHFERRHVRLSLEPPVVIPGPSELVHPPLYYWLAARVAQPLGDAPILARLAAVRAFGVLLAALTAWVCGAIGRLLWPDRPNLALAPVLSVAALPTFTLFSGAANNDVLANLIAALLVLVVLLGIVRRTPLSRPLPWLALLAVLVVAAIFTKRTTLALLPLVAVALLIRLQWRWRVVAIAVLLLAGPGLILLMPQQRLAFWMAPAVARDAYRCPNGYVGEWSICLPARAPYRLTQQVPIVRARALAGTPLTLGFWVRATTPQQQLAVTVDYGRGIAASHTVQPGLDWQFVTVPVPPQESPRLLRVQFSPAADAGGRIYLDGVILAPWRYSGSPPQPVDHEATWMTWDGRQVHNELLNGSGEQATLMAPQGVTPRIQRMLNSVVDTVDALLRQPGLVRDAWPVGLERGREAFGMFWATVGWSDPVLFPDWLLGALAVLVMLAAAGVLWSLVGACRERRLVLALLIVAWLLVLAAAFLRDLPPRMAIIISGRYLFPGLAPFTALVAVGWRRLWPAGDNSFRSALLALVLVIHGLFVTLLWWPYFVEGIG